jgi:hypothetical protein
MSIEIINDNKTSIYNITIDQLTNINNGINNVFLEYIIYPIYLLFNGWIYLRDLYIDFIKFIIQYNEITKFIPNIFILVITIVIVLLISFIVKKV